MAGATKCPLLPPFKNKAKAYSSTLFANNFLGLKSGYDLRDNFCQKDFFAINSKMEPKIVSKNWLLSNKPYPCAQKNCALFQPKIPLLKVSMFRNAALKRQGDILNSVVCKWRSLKKECRNIVLNLTPVRAFLCFY